MTLDEQVKYMETGLDAITYSLRKDKSLSEFRRIRIMDHGIAYTEVIESLKRFRQLLEGLES